MALLEAMREERASDIQDLCDAGCSAGSWWSAKAFGGSHVLYALNMSGRTVASSHSDTRNITIAKRMHTKTPTPRPILPLQSRRGSEAEAESQRRAAEEGGALWDCKSRNNAPGSSKLRVSTSAHENTLNSGADSPSGRDTRTVCPHWEITVITVHYKKEFIIDSLSVIIRFPFLFALAMNSNADFQEFSFCYSVVLFHRTCKPTYFILHLQPAKLPGHTGEQMNN